MIQLFDGFTVLVAALMVGNELAVAVFVHPTFTSLPDEEHAAAASALARLLGRVMPFWYALVLALTAVDAYLHWRADGELPRLITASAILWAVSIVFTIAALVPINNRIASWTRATRPPDWKRARQQWDRLHRWRVVLLVVALTLLLAGILHIGGAAA